MITKKCLDCGEKKTEKDLVKNAAQKDGYRALCKECKKLRAAKAEPKKCADPSCERMVKNDRVCWEHKPIRGKLEKDYGSWKTSAGYIMLYNPTYEHARKGGIVFEHIYVVEQQIGRRLLDSENVHHKNGVRHDNRLENLELWSKSQPAGQRVEDKVAWAKELLALYEPEALA